jgi:hypothetical protein
MRHHSINTPSHLTDGHRNLSMIHARVPSHQAGERPHLQIRAVTPRLPPPIGHHRMMMTTTIRGIINPHTITDTLCLRHGNRLHVEVKRGSRSSQHNGNGFNRPQTVVVLHLWLHRLW